MGDAQGWREWNLLWGFLGKSVLKTGYSEQCSMGSSQLSEAAQFETLHSANLLKLQ